MPRPPLKQVPPNECIASLGREGTNNTAGVSCAVAETRISAVGGMQQTYQGGSATDEVLVEVMFQCQCIEICDVET